MKKNNLLLPAIGIVLTGGTLVAINEFTEITWIRDYAYILITVAMLVGVLLANLGRKSQG